jgi:hypothetical protein
MVNKFIFLLIGIITLVVIPVSVYAYLCGFCLVAATCGESGVCGDTCYYTVEASPDCEPSALQCSFPYADPNKPSCTAPYYQPHLCYYGGFSVCTDWKGWDCNYNYWCNVCSEGGYGHKRADCTSSGCTNYRCIPGECGANCVVNADCPSGSTCEDCVCTGPCTGQPDGTPCPDDGNSCTNDVCSGQVCTHPPNHYCGDGVCQSNCGETCSSCSSDCCSTIYWTIRVSPYNFGSVCVKRRYTSGSGYCTQTSMNVQFSSGTQVEMRATPAGGRSFDGFGNDGAGIPRTYTNPIYFTADASGTIYSYFKCTDSNSCGGSCGTCPEDYTCSNGVCEYVPCSGSAGSEGPTSSCASGSYYSIDYWGDCYDYGQDYYCNDDCQSYFGSGATGTLTADYICFVYGIGFDCRCDVNMEGQPCGTIDCRSNCCDGSVWYAYPSTCSRICSGGTCQSCNCGPTAYLCSEPGNYDGDMIACNCDCGGFDVAESAANHNCDDGIDNDCDGNIDCDDSACASDPACAVCSPDGCNGVCPQFCTVSQDPDCGCSDNNGCCPTGCTCSNDNDCCTCTDTDSAASDQYKTAGTCTDAISSHPDTCSANILTEWYCSGTSCLSTTKNCEDYEGLYCNAGNGNIYRDEWRCSGSPGYCNNGATDTLVETCPACSDTDSGQTYTTQGTVTYRTGCSSGQTSCPSPTSYTDYCIDASTLRELYCSGNNGAYIDYNCANLGAGYTCSGGRCTLDNPPSCSISSISESSSYSYVSGSTVWYNTAGTGSFTVNVNANDNEGISFVRFLTTVSGGVDDSTPPYSRTYNWDSADTFSGSSTVTVFDTINQQGTCTFTVTRDTIAPSTTASFSGSYSITLTRSDNSGGSGVATTYYCTDITNTCNPTNVYSSTISTSCSGCCYIRYYSIDRVNNQESIKSSSFGPTCGCECTSGLCCDGCNYLPSGTVCRASTDPVCDPAETCTGSSANCPSDYVRPSGYDCGNCKTCDGSGNCNYLCSGSESSCECIGDACIDCSNYFGTACDYGTCTIGQRPSWSCSSGSCTYSCYNDPGCTCDNDGVCDAGETYANCPQDCCDSDCTATSDSICHTECDPYCGIVDSQCNGDVINSCGDSSGDCLGCDYRYCSSQYGTACGQDICAPTEKPSWICSGTSCSISSCNFDPSCLKPCTLTLASISDNCGSGSSLYCEEDETISMSGTYTGDCSAMTFFQIDATNGGSCDIQYTGGILSGISSPVSGGGIDGGTFNSIWTISSVPLECSGVTVQATYAALYEGFPDGGGQSTIIGQPAVSGSFRFVDIAVPITVTSSPATGSGFVLVDSNPITTPQTYTGSQGSSHSLSANSPVSCGVDCNYVFSSWSDGGAQTHTITVPSSATTYTAYYQTVYDECDSDSDCEDGNVCTNDWCERPSDIDSVCHNDPVGPGVPCGTYPCPEEDYCTDSTLNYYPATCTLYCIGDTCQSSCACTSTPLDCSQTGSSYSGSFNDPNVACNCNCPDYSSLYYDVLESAANNNCDDGIDNDCDGKIDGDDRPNCPPNNIKFSGNLQYSTGNPVSNSWIEVRIKNETYGFEKSSYNETTIDGNFTVTLMYLPTNIMHSNFDVSIYVVGEVEAIYECYYDRDVGFCNPT